MKKYSRLLCILMAVSIVVSGINLNVYASDYDSSREFIVFDNETQTVVSETEVGIIDLENEAEDEKNGEERIDSEDEAKDEVNEEERTDSESEAEDGGNREEHTDSENEAEDEVNGEECTDSENEAENEVNGEECTDSENEAEDGGNEEEASVSDNNEITLSENEMQAADTLSKEEWPDKRKANDLLEFQVIEAQRDNIEGEVYEVEELCEQLENSDIHLSDSYGSYWDNYTNYYVYNQLNATEKKLWDAMEVLYTKYLVENTNLKREYGDVMTGYIKVDSKISNEKLTDLAFMFRYCHPQFYFLMSRFCIVSSGSSRSFAFVVYDAFQKGAERRNATEEISNLLEIWQKQIDACSTEPEKVKKIHDLICNKVDYNYEAVNNGILNVEQTEFTQSAYSVLCMDKTVCAGYTQAFTWLCNAVDIDCFGVTGSNHGWNKVNVNDNWYNVDCTWNDGEGIGNISYWCYLISDSEIDNIGGHVEEDKWYSYLPICTLDSGSDYSNAKNPPIVTEQVKTPFIGVTQNKDSYNVQLSTTTPGARIYYTTNG